MRTGREGAAFSHADKPAERPAFDGGAGRRAKAEAIDEAKYCASVVQIKAVGEVEYVTWWV